MHGLGEWRINLDTQHKALFDYGNQLATLLSAGADDHKLKAQLDQLLDHTQLHFSYEEKILAAIAYPECAEHAEIHRNLNLQITRLREAYERGEIRDSAFFSHVFDNLILDHLNREDLKYFSWIKV